MRITNRLGLPEAFVRAVKNDPYNNFGTLSVTTLLRPPQMVRLEKQHWNDLEEDAADRVWTIFGQAGHSVLERTNQDGDVVEQRYYMTVNEVNISGQIDRLTKDGVIVDWKFTSVWTVLDCLKNGIKPEWEQQLNMLAALVREHDRQVQALRIIAVCRDWRSFEASKSDDYPNKVEVLKAPLWPHEQAMEFIRERVRLHTMETPVPCTDEDRWAQPETWAVKRKGQKKALRVLHDEFEAIEWAHQNGLMKEVEKGVSRLKPDITVEKRPKVFTRCERYCSVSKFCKQYAPD